MSYPAFFVEHDNNIIKCLNRFDALSSNDQEDEELAAFPLLCNATECPEASHRHKMPHAPRKSSQTLRKRKEKNPNKLDDADFEKVLIEMNKQYEGHIEKTHIEKNTQDEASIRKLWPQRLQSPVAGSGRPVADRSHDCDVISQAATDPCIRLQEDAQRDEQTGRGLHPDRGRAGHSDLHGIRVARGE